MQVRLSTRLPDTVTHIEVEDTSSSAQLAIAIERKQIKISLLCRFEKSLAQGINRRRFFNVYLSEYALKIGFCLTSTPSIASQLVPAIHVIVRSAKGDARIMRATSTQNTTT